jgi:hypothetical protein
VTSGPTDCENEDIARTIRLVIATRMFLRFTVCSPYDELLKALFLRRMKSDARTRGIALSQLHFVDFCLPALSGGIVMTLWRVVSPS